MAATITIHMILIIEIEIVLSTVVSKVKKELSSLSEFTFTQNVLCISNQALCTSIYILLC